MNGKKAKMIRKMMKETTGLDYKAAPQVRNLYRRAKREALKV